jgi:hypothetical protein
MPRPFQLLLKLPRLPFPIAFDILFRHGGFSAFARLHHCPAEAHYQFWRLYFVSSSIGKLNPAHISQWVEVMCTCHIVQSLPHPAHAVFLLRPVVREIPESVAAWSAAGGRGGNQLLDSAAVVRAMRVFLSARGWEDDAAVREWFPAAGTVSRKEGGWRQSVNVWRQFVDEAVGNHAFTRYWWTAQREGPFYLLLDNRDVSMGEMIAVLVKRERDWLEGRLKREETATMQREAERKRWRKDELAKHDSKQKQTPSDKRRCSSEPQAGGLVVPLPKKPTTTATTPSLSSSSKSEIARLTSIRLSDHISTLAQVQQALSSMKTKTLSRQFKFVACLIVSLGHLYPRIKWSLRLLLHEAVAGARSHWAVERELYWVRYRRDGEPLRKLVGMVEKSGRGVGGRF